MIAEVLTIVKQYLLYTHVFSMHIIIYMMMTLVFIMVVLTLSSLTHYPVRSDFHFGLKVIGSELFYILACRSILLFVSLRKHSKHTYTASKLIQTTAEDNQRWQIIQNPMLSPRGHKSEPLVNHAVWEMACSVKGFRQILEFI